MARNVVKYVCQECGAIHPKWGGQCGECKAWNTLVQETTAEAAPKGLGNKKGRRIEFTALKGESEKPARLVSGIKEFDRATGGGLVPGSALLVGGDPGVGKSTILLQVAAQLAAQHNCAYISGEEAIDQLRLRAERLGVDDAPVQLAAATSVRDIVTTLEEPDAPRVVVIDSIQTMYVDSVDSAPGTVTQVRTSAHELIRLAKRMGFCVILVGHVTKEGTIAGPRILEHMVDSVLYFEGERGHQFRILRAVKNRFGATDEIGVFEMGDRGLSEVENPSALFLSDRDGAISGAAVFAGLEGSRPVLVEIQSLVSPSHLATPRRAVVGWDSNRLAMIMAVLDTRCALAMSSGDVYLNVAGGLRVNEPAADLAVVAALISALSDVPLPTETVFFGEVGLSGEVRPVSQAENRLREATKLGFKHAVMPRLRNNKKQSRHQGLSVLEVDHVAELAARFGPDRQQDNDINVVRVT